ncbi:hypothetical protein WN943_001630 [Citrus x changshan-huyou]
MLNLLTPLTVCLRWYVWRCAEGENGTREHVCVIWRWDYFVFAIISEAIPTYISLYASFLDVINYSLSPFRYQ